MATSNIIGQLLESSAVHHEWVQPLSAALQTVDTEYLESLLHDSDWLPGKQKLFAAFQRDLSGCRYILFGESPYPRKESANGIAFYDAAVDKLWSDKGLSKKVNRATSLRNIMKTALVAERLLKADEDGKITQPAIAALDNSRLTQTIDQLFANLQRLGFILFNATPVLHPQRKPAQEARYWSGFVEQLLIQIAQKKTCLPTLILWGQIAQNIEAIPVVKGFPRLRSEHPYNISFIHNPDMQQLFKSLKLLSGFYKHNHK